MRSFLFWLFSCVAGALRSIENAVKQVQEYVQQREDRIVYAEFEAAIDAWEKRTGRVVERAPRLFEPDEQGYRKGDWKHFAAFLGSREATQWRRYGYDWKKALTEWRTFGIAEPEMRIEGEEDDSNEANDL